MYKTQSTIHHDRLTRWMMLDDNQKEMVIIGLLNKQGIQIPKLKSYKLILNIRIKILKILCKNFEDVLNR